MQNSTLIFIGGNDLHGVPKIITKETYDYQKEQFAPVLEAAQSSTGQDLAVVGEFVEQENLELKSLIFDHSSIALSSSIGLPAVANLRIVNPNNCKFYIRFDLTDQIFQSISHIQSKRCIMPFEELNLTVVCCSHHPGWFKDVYTLRYGNESSISFDVSLFVKLKDIQEVDRTILSQRTAERNAQWAVDSIFKRLWDSVEYKRTIIEPLLFYIPLQLHSKVSHLKISTKNKFFLDIEKQLEPVDVPYYLEMVKAFTQNDLFLPSGQLRVFDKTCFRDYQIDLSACFGKCLDLFCEDLIKLKKLKKKDKKINIEDGLRTHFLTFMDVLSVFVNK